MLRPRIIPCLLLHNRGLVKTVQFKDPKYIGDPLNAVRIFNEKEIDELIVLDIDATVEQREPLYDVIQSLAAECRMPLCYGGGVKKIEQFERIIRLGVEKVAISSVAVDNSEIIQQAASRIGSQSVVVVMDVKKTGFRRQYEIVTHNSVKRSGIQPVEFARQIQSAGAGEIVINSVDRDGKMQGYDHELVREIRAAVTIPLTVLGGAGSLEDITALLKEFGTVGAAAGSLFVFKGPYRAVLINYPNEEEKQRLLEAAG